MTEFKRLYSRYAKATRDKRLFGSIVLDDDKTSDLKICIENTTNTRKNFIIVTMPQIHKFFRRLVCVFFPALVNQKALSSNG